MKKMFIAAASMFTAFFAVSVFAADLLEVYQQALRSDPTFKEANAQWLAQRENLPISRANLLPQLSATGSLGRSYNSSELGNPGGDNAKYYDNSSSFSLNLSQPIFNFSNWAALRGAKATVRQAEADFASAAQDLMYRVASAYFSILQAQDVLRFTREDKKAFGEQLRQQKQRYAVGLIPITDVNDAQASYDGTVAQEIAAENDLQDQEEKLQEITNLKYASLNTLRANLPLVKPNPENIEKWVKTAEQQNYSLLSARYAAIAAREDVSTQEGGHFPTLNATGGYGYQYDENGGRSLGQLSRSKSLSAGLSVNIPLFSGGSVTALTQKSGHLYQKAIAMQEKAHRSTVSGTRQAYLGVMSGISAIKADRQMVKSKLSALLSRQNSYAAGLRTIVEVLQAQSDLYEAEKTYAKDQYTYILETLTLKQQAGTLSAADLEKINQWLEKSGRLIDPSPQQNDFADSIVDTIKSADNEKESNDKASKQQEEPQQKVTVQQPAPQPIAHIDNAKQPVPEVKTSAVKTASANPVSPAGLTTPAANPVSAISNNKLASAAQPLPQAVAKTTQVLPQAAPQTIQPQVKNVSVPQPGANLSVSTPVSTPAPVASSVSAPAVAAVPATVKAPQPVAISASSVSEVKPIPANAPAATSGANVSQPVAPVAVVASAPVPTPVANSSAPAQPAVAPVSNARAPIVTPVVVAKPVQTIQAQHAQVEQQPTTSVPASAKKKHLTYAEKYLKHMNPDHYTIELFKSDDKQKIVNFAVLNKMQDQTVLLTQTTNGKISYSLIYGKYENLSQANYAAKRIATTIKEDLNTHVVQFSTIKN